MSNKNDIGDHKSSAGDVGIVISKGEIVRSDLTDKEKIGDIQMRVAELERLTKQNEKWSSLMEWMRYLQENGLANKLNFEWLQENVEELKRR